MYAPPPDAIGTWSSITPDRSTVALEFNERCSRTWPRRHQSSGRVDPSVAVTTTLFVPPPTSRSPFMPRNKNCSVIVFVGPEPTTTLTREWPRHSFQVGWTVTGFSS